nr:AraC family transcriptional regulator [Yoonia maritima]
MGYLMKWSMTLAKHMLRSDLYGVAEVATRTGYGSVSAFSTAFARNVGQGPKQYARACRRS